MLYFLSTTKLDNTKYVAESKQCNVKFEEVYLNTSYGKTHVLILGDSSKEKFFALHHDNNLL